MVKPAYDLDALQRMAYFDYNSSLMPARSGEWQPLPAPEAGYPRLVRSDCADIVFGEYRQDEDVLGELVPFAHDENYIEPWREGKPVKVLKNKVEELAGKYGAPYESTQNTLFSWLSLLIHIKVHFKAIEKLNQTEGGYLELFDHLKTEREAIKARMKRNGNQTTRDPSHPLLYRFALYNRSTQSEEKDGSELHPLQKDVSKDLDDILPDNGEPFEPTLDELELIQVGFLLDMLLEQEDRESNEIDIGAFRSVIAERLFSNLDLSLSNRGELDSNFTLTLDGFVLECPVGVWVDYKLTQAWRNGIPLKICEHCKIVFAPMNRKAKYCKSGRCKEAQSNKKRKERTVNKPK